MKRTAVLGAMAGLLVLGTICISGAAWHPPAHARGTAVLQLFTSQGCSSCPPADELLSAIGRDRSPSIIPLAYHVDYWNSLGWSDPFSSATWSERQREYSRSLRSTVYTPQLVVNGRTEMVGSSAQSVHTAIERALEQTPEAVVRVDRVAEGATAIHAVVSAHVDRNVAGRGARIVVVLFENGVVTNVRGGENNGRRLVNDSIVRWESNATGVDRSGAAIASVDIPLDRRWNPTHLGLAAFVQEDRTHAIDGAAAQMVTNQPVH